MTKRTRQSRSGNSSKLDSLTHDDYLTLWLNYESKIDELRGHFLTIAGLLFALQSGIFALMLDKIYLSEKSSSLVCTAACILIILSIVTFVSLIFLSKLYYSHINTNVCRSKFVLIQDDANVLKTFNCKLKKHIRDEWKEKHKYLSKICKILRYLGYKPGKATKVIWMTLFIYVLVFLGTISLPLFKTHQQGFPIVMEKP